VKIKPRREGTRKYKSHILIVTEGEKTEPIYFASMKKAEKIHATKLEILPSEFGTSPINVVDFAIEMKSINARANRRFGDPKFDDIYCVIDRDSHLRFNDACIKAKAHGIEIIRSIPCFEIWYLLHFKYSSKIHFDRPKLYSQLKKILGTYEKNHDLYNILKSRQYSALDNATKLYKEQQTIYDLDREHPNPLTEVHNLVTKILQQG
jgi:hypothetical protein